MGIPYKSHVNDVLVLFKYIKLEDTSPGKRSLGV